jgi:topoisomerase-4 subunit A
LQQAIFVDSTGRAYSLDAHQLPAARGYGEPLSGTVDPPDGATFAAVLIGEPDDLWLLASDAGYGFTVKLRELYARNKKGKSVLKVPENARVLPAQPVGGPASLAVLVNNDGEVLALPVAQIEEMSAGKGQNLYGIPGRKSAERDEFLVALAVVAPGELLTIYSGNSAPMKLKFDELEQFQDKKGQRRQRFSRAYKQIDRLEVGPA